jgi:hypothetical protein
MSTAIAEARIRSWRRIAPGNIVQWYAAFVLLNLMDVLLTLFILQHHGEETNPVCRAILDYGGSSQFVLFKIMQCALVIIIVQLVYVRRPPAARMLVGVGCAVYFVLMFWDSYLLSHI